MHLPTKVHSLFVTTYLRIKHNSDSDSGYRLGFYDTGAKWIPLNMVLVPELT